MPSNNIKIKNGKSSLSEFVKRPLPTEKEVEAFDNYVENEVRENEIKESLAEIYQDDDGKVVNVKKLETKKRRGFFFWLSVLIFLACVLAGTAYFGYYFYFLKSNPALSTVKLEIAGEKEIAAGKEFFYSVNYKNEDRASLNDIEIKAAYPENFIFLESEPAASEKNNIWKVASLGSHRSDVIKIKGRLVGELSKANLISADMTYRPANFSSEFKKSASLETVISDIGLEFSVISNSNIVVGDDNEIVVKYKAREENFLNNFRLSVLLPENMEFVNSNKGVVATTTGQLSGEQTGQGNLGPQLVRPGVWLIGEIDENEKDLIIKFKVKEKKSDKQDLVLKFENLVTQNAEDKYYLIYEKTISFEVIKSDLNVNLIINGSSADQGVNFGQILNYSISYINKGETEMKDVLLMAVIESDFLDWQTLSDQAHGKVSGNTISWSKEEIPALAAVAKDQEGVIDFSSKVKPEQPTDLSKNYQVKSYVQFNIEGREAREDSDNRSNIIINKINSDLNLVEQVRYFNDDNIAVGTGPLPPKVNETTSCKVYWKLTNSLHELKDLEIFINLPNYVRWEDKNRATAGQVEYDSQNNRVTWLIGRLPITVYQAEAEFNISVTPVEADRNKVMVLLSGTAVSAVDAETGAGINKTIKAKTTKLEDDSIANSDGMVE